MPIKRGEKLAKVLVMGLGLQIEGGNYMLCDGSSHCKRCHLITLQTDSNMTLKEKESGIMRVAVTYDNMGASSKEKRNQAESKKGRD